MSIQKIRLAFSTMEEDHRFIYSKSVIEFVTVALEYCSFVEQASQLSKAEFADKGTKLLALLYLKAALLPTLEEEEDVLLELSVTEEMYESVRQQIAALLGEQDTYLETFHPDMPFSDTPIAAFISEDLADVYQDVGNFVELYRQGYEEVMEAAVALCHTNFQAFWGQQLLNALKALHAVRYTETEQEDNVNEE